MHCHLARGQCGAGHIIGLRSRLISILAGFGLVRSKLTSFIRDNPYPRHCFHAYSDTSPQAVKASGRAAQLSAE